MSRVLVFILLTVTAWGAAAQDQPPQWPLDLDSRFLTGNFMEPRGGRFHSGLDLKTNSRTGYAVVAVRDGWISRVKLASGGYGKAIYLRGDDGLTYVYGHLDRLADGLREHVRILQDRRGSYDLDLAFEPGAWPVARGEVLALSGQSATSGPHLHFEVRAADGSPLDPQAHGFAVDDTIAPEILAVRAVTAFGGEGAPTLRWGDGETPLSGRLPDLQLPSGQVRFAARIVERSDRLRYRLGAWRVRLYVDDHEVFASRNDQLRWGRNRQQRLEYLRTPLGQERWLWRDHRVTLDGRSSFDGFSQADLPPGRHRLRLVAEDRAGNRSEVRWEVDVVPQLGDLADPGWPAVGFVYPEPWLVEPAGPAPTEGVCADSEPPIHWRRGEPMTPVPLRWLQLAGLEPLTAAVHFRPSGPTLLDPVAVTWPHLAVADLPAAGDPTVAVYRLGDDEWEYETDLRESLAFDLDRPGVHAVLRDVAAPVIATVTVDTLLTRLPERRRHGIAMPRWPVIRIPVGDHGSGIDWDSLSVKLSGGTLVVEPDPPRDRILVELPDALPPGRHVLVVDVADRAGHRCRADLPVYLRAGPGP